MDNLNSMIDLYIAFGLIAVIIVLSLILNMAALPKKSLPFILASFAALLGIPILKKIRRNSLKKALKKCEALLQEREKRLETLQRTYSISEKALLPVNSELHKQRAAYKKSILLLDARGKLKKQAIERLSGHALEEEYNRVFEQ